MKTKTPKCKFCGGAHYQTFCTKKPRKPIATRKPLRPTRTSFTAKTRLSHSRPKKTLKRSQIGSRSKSPRRLLIAKADRVFSIYIRLRYAENGEAYCVTCGAHGPWRGMQNGHFISRRKMNLRWDEVNCNVQCKHCNETLAGNLSKYRTFIVAQYGQKELDRLMLTSKQVRKVRADEIQAIITKYEQEVRNLSKDCA